MPRREPIKQSSNAVTQQQERQAAVLKQRINGGGGGAVASAMSVANTVKTGKKHVHMRSEGHQKLWALSANLPSPPDKFVADKIYKIKLKRAVTPAGHSFRLRPMQDVQVTGQLAEEIREHISGAVMVG